MNYWPGKLLRAAGLLIVILVGCGFLEKENPQQIEKIRPGWESLFDGKTLTGWKKTLFGGEGPVKVKEGVIYLSYGEMLTGITWTGDFPESDYELELEASRIQGSDFFLGLTFPVKKSFCSLILGGWGGAVVGLSSIDGFDASENDTTLLKGFKRGRWFKIRLKVDQDTIQVWIDEELVIDLETEGKEIGIRPEVRLSRPLGIASFQTRSGIRNIWYRKLTGNTENDFE